MITTLKEFVLLEKKEEIKEEEYSNRYREIMHNMHKADTMGTKDITFTEDLKRKVLTKEPISPIGEEIKFQLNIYVNDEIIYTYFRANEKDVKYLKKLLKVRMRHTGFDTDAVKMEYTSEFEKRKQFLE